MSKIEDYNFTENDWTHFHDVILDVTWENGTVSLNRKEMEQLFMELPEEMRMDAQRLGMGDIFWKDNLWTWYEQNKDLQNEKWIESGNVTKTFRLGDEPELIHVIKTGFEDKYMVVHEDAYELNIGNVEFGTKLEIENKFGITL